METSPQPGAAPRLVLRGQRCQGEAMIPRSPGATVRGRRREQSDRNTDTKECENETHGTVAGQKGRVTLDGQGQPVTATCKFSYIFH